MYLYKTRLGTFTRFFQFFGGEILVFTLMTFLLKNNGVLSSIFSVDFLNFILFGILFYVTFFTLYEIGYIMNDCLATKSESNPANRYSGSNWKHLVIAKIAFFILLSVLCRMLFTFNFLNFILYSCITMVVFYFHNRLIVQERIFTYFWLELMRLMILPFVMFDGSVNILISLVLVSPELIRRTIRYSRLKLFVSDRKFSFFDLKAFLGSALMVILFLISYNYSLITIPAVVYSISISGILLSLYLKA
jgi:hypothetical protein